MTDPAGPEPLTERQRQVLDLLARGRTNAQIADVLGISLDGAKWHVSEVTGRLGVSNREEAALVWRMERRPLRRMRGWVGGLPLSPTGVAIAGGGLALGAVAVLAFFLLSDLRAKSEPQAETPMPPLPADLANPAVPTLLYIDASQTEYPYTAQIVTFDVASGELSRVPIEGVTDVARVGTSIIGIADHALVQFDFEGTVFRTIYSADALDSFALSRDATRVIVAGDNHTAIVDLATAEVLANVAASDFPGWAEGSRFSRTPAWLEGGDVALVPLIRPERGPAARPGYVLIEEQQAPTFREVSGSLSVSPNGSMLLVGDPDGCDADQPPRVLDAMTGSQIAVLPANKDTRLDLVWSDSGTVLSRNATEVEDFGPCRETDQASVYWEEFDPVTRATMRVDDFATILAAGLRQLWGGEIELACDSGVPLRFSNGTPDCPAGSSIGFYFRGFPLHANNPRLFLGVYEP